MASARVTQPAPQVKVLLREVETLWSEAPLKLLVTQLTRQIQQDSYKSSAQDRKMLKLRMLRLHMRLAVLHCFFRPDHMAVGMLEGLLKETRDRSMQQRGSAQKLSAQQAQHEFLAWVEGSLQPALQALTTVHAHDLMGCLRDATQNSVSALKLVGEQPSGMEAQIFRLRMQVGDSTKNTSMGRIKRVLEQMRETSPVVCISCWFAESRGWYKRARRQAYIDSQKSNKED